MSELDPAELVANAGSYQDLDGNPWNGLFVRSQVQIALDSAAATGHRMNPFEVADIFGRGVLSTIMDEGAYPIVEAPDQPARTLTEQRDRLGLTIDEVARAAGLDKDVIVGAETPGTLTPVRLLERLSQNLALDENLIGLARGSGTSIALSTRLKTMLDRTGRANATLTPATVARLAEAAWVIARQVDLESRLGFSADSVLARIQPVPVEPGPGYRQGYDLARETRRVLGLGDEEPIESMRALLGEKVGIPLLTVELGQRVAGATLANGTRRGIVVNASGPTRNPWIRRITAAHELCHYLWDPDTDLAALRVDTTDTVDFGTKPTDLVEQRANAFAVEFLAPQKGLRRLAEKAGSRDEALEAISGHFGISARAAGYHLQNAHLTRKELFGEGDPVIEPADKWYTAEDFDLDWFPIKSVAYARRGRFANLVARAVERGRITADSGAVLLAVPLEEFKRGFESILGLGKRTDRPG